MCLSYLERILSFNSFAIKWQNIKGWMDVNGQVYGQDAAILSDFKTYFAEYLLLEFEQNPYPLYASFTSIIQCR